MSTLILLICLATAVAAVARAFRDTEAEPLELLVAPDRAEAAPEAEAGVEPEGDTGDSTSSPAAG